MAERLARDPFRSDPFLTRGFFEPIKASTSCETTKSRFGEVISRNFTLATFATENWMPGTPSVLFL